MNTLQFDPAKRAVINPEDCFAPVKDCPKTVVTCFARNLVEYAVEKFGAAEVGATKDANGPTPLYRIPGTSVGLTMTLVGAPSAVGQYEDLFAMGVERVLVFGTCGALSKSIGDCAILIPDRAVRDEGISYHYAPASDEIAANAGTLNLLRGFFEEKHLSCTVGKTWTTDAFYRETPNKVAQRQQEGCISVDMECSALAALAQFRGKRIAQFFYAADNLDGEIWDERSLSNEEGVDAKFRLVELAVELGKRWERVASLLDGICADFRNVLGEKLTGFYVHGSVAFGCFRWEKGDVDFLAVVNDALTPEEKQALIRVMLEKTPDAPEKGLEMSVVREECCRNFVHPAAFELHYSNSHLERCRTEIDKYCREMNGVDPDLTAHFAAINEAGIVWWGKDKAEVFAGIPKNALMESILYDIEDEVTNPVYSALNLCRAWAWAEEEKYLSKAQGVPWAAAKLPEELRAIAGKALAAYVSDAPGLEVDEVRQLQAFVLRKIKKQTS